MAEFTHKVVVEFYLKPEGIKEDTEIRAWVLGYLHNKLPELDIENVIVKKLL